MTISAVNQSAVACWQGAGGRGEALRIYIHICHRVITVLNDKVYLCEVSQLARHIYLKASPLPPAPCQQATDDRMTREMGHFFYLKMSFWRPWGSFLGAWDTILVILGSRGTPNGHSEVQMSIFIDFRVDLGSLLGPTLAIILWFSGILDTKMRDSFQVRVFGDPGMEMMPECMGCMCLNHTKTAVFEWFHFFHLFSNLESWGRGFGHMLVSFGDPGGTFSDF